MVLHHVADCASFLVITTAVADAEFFADGDLNVINGFAVPEPLENGIGKAEHQNVLHGFLAKIMVNAANLRFMREACQLGVQRVRGCEVMAERLLHDEALPAAFVAVFVQKFGIVQLFDDNAELLGCVAR